MKPLVFTNGCFDVLHVGHIRLLQFCAQHGDVIVGLNSDLSVQSLKGSTRPINNEYDRKEVLEALRSVYAVRMFHGDRCTDTILSLRPNIYVKGGDYTLETLHPEERAALEEVGAKILFFPTVKGYSSTAAIEKLCPPTK